MTLGMFPMHVMVGIWGYIIIATAIKVFWVFLGFFRGGGVIVKQLNTVKAIINKKITHHRDMTKNRMPLQ